MNFINCENNNKYFSYFDICLTLVVNIQVSLKYLYSISVNIQ